jgi:hypothetical protein
MLNALRYGRRLRAGLMAVVLGVAGNDAMAQDTAVVFVHGIRTTQDIWNPIVPTITAGLKVQAVRTTTDWVQSVALQMNTLKEYLNSNAHTFDQGRRMPFVARSNGGLISRDYSRVYGRVSQLVTVATPHQGAYLANNVNSGVVLITAAAMFDALYSPISFYDQEDAENPAVLTWANNVMYPIAQMFYGLEMTLCMQVGFCPTLDVMVDLAEGSDVTDYEYGRLNNETNLAREASGPSAINPRIGLYTEVTPEGALFEVQNFYRPDWMNVQYGAIAAYLAGYDHYRWHWDPWLADNVWRWVDGAVALIDIDATWQQLIGTLTYYQRILDPDSHEWVTAMGWMPNDGVVPVLSAAFPGGTRSQRVPGDIAHGKQAENPTVRDYIYDVLRYDFQIPEREPPPPQGTYWAQINGPASVKPSTLCTWSATTDLPSAQFNWLVNGVWAGNGVQFSRSSTASFTLKLEASGPQGNASHTRSITVSSAAGACGPN